MKAIRVGIMDDHPTMGMALKLQLDQCGFQVPIAANSKSNLFQELLRHQVDILVLDILVPDAAGIDVFEELQREQPAIKLIAFSSLGSPILVENLLEAGVKGYVSKRQDPRDVCIAVETVADGGIYLPDQYAFLKDKYRMTETTLLSGREIEILRMISQEMISKEISDRLGISVFTVENHRKNIFQKLRVKNLAGAIMEATRQGYLS